MLRTHLAATGTAVAATAVVGSIASREVTGAWYRRLAKPPFQPPGPTFGIVWTLLYTDIAVTAALALDRLAESDPEAAARYRWALAVNLVLNASWSWVFFRGQRLGWAVVVAKVLALSSIDLVRRTAAADGRVAAALAPYAVWCSFATVLSADIWRRNRARG